MTHNLDNAIRDVRARLRSGQSSPSERAYHRGFHQALCFASLCLERAGSLDEARAIVGRAEDVAQAIRNRVPPAVPCAPGGMLDVVSRRVFGGIEPAEGPVDGGGNS